MAQNTDMCEEDAEALKVRRAELHTFMQEITAAALMLPQPETYLEAERAVRTIAAADRLIQQLDLTKPIEDDTAPTPALKPTLASMRKGLRMLADRMMAAAKTIPLPENALTALHALRYARAYDRMLTQLYTPPKPRPSPPPKPNPREDTHRANQLRRELWEKFSSHPEAKAIREARRLSAELAAKAKSLGQSDPQPQNPDDVVPNNLEQSETTEPPAAETAVLNPQPEISEGQDDKDSGQTLNRPDTS